MLFLIIRYFVINGVFAASLFYGLVYHIEGALNIGIFMAWLFGTFGTILLLGMIAFPEIIVNEVVKKNKPFSVPEWFDQTFDTIITVILVWHGYYTLSAFYVMSMIGSHLLRTAVTEHILELIENKG